MVRPDGEGDGLRIVSSFFLRMGDVFVHSCNTVKGVFVVNGSG